MADQYKLVEEKNDNLWFEGSPIILCAWRLEADTASGELFASGKFLNVTPDNLRSLTTDVICYDEERTLLEVITGITFTGLNVARNADFGYNRRIPINDANTRSVEFVLREVRNVEDQAWENKRGKRFDRKLEQHSIFDAQGDYNKQFLHLCARSGIDGTMMVFEPVFQKSHWLCACGGFNWNDERVCSQCKVGRSWLEKNTRIQTLEEYKEKQARESQDMITQIQSRASRADDKESEREEFKRRKEALEKQRKQQKSRKLRKRLLIVILVVLIGGGIGYGIFGFAIPYFKYSDAITAMQNEEYDKAITAFSELGSFMDSQEHVTECKYQKADGLYRKGKYLEAAKLFESISPYSDSRERYTQSMLALADEEMEALHYDKAVEYYSKLPNNEEAKKKMDECLAGLYRQAETYIKNVRYQVAYDKFSFLKNYNYKDAETRMDECMYLYAKRCMALQQYAKALELYKSANGYKDSAEKIKENMMLAAIISSATADKPAEWSNDKTTCSKCKKDTASFSLTFSVDGVMVSNFDCTEHKVAKNEKTISYRYKIQDNTLYQMDYDGKTKWQKYADIYSLKPSEDNKNYELVISDPMNPKQKLTLYGTVKQ